MAEQTPTPQTSIAIPVSLETVGVLIGYLFQFLLFAQLFRAMNKVLEKVFS